MLVQAADAAAKTENKNIPAPTVGREKRESSASLTDPIERARELNIGGIDWSPDSARLLFSKGGDLYVKDLEKGSLARRITRTVLPELQAHWLPDGHRVLYQSSGNLFVLDVDHASIVQLTREGGVSSAARADSTAAQSQIGGSSSTI